MESAPIHVKLRVSWGQLQTLYRKDLARNGFFLRATRPPDIGARMSISLTLPSATVVVLDGTVVAHVPPGGLGGRGPGVDLRLEPISQTTMWLIESALSAHRSQGMPVSGRPAAAAGASAPPGSPPAEEPRRTPSMDEGSELASAEQGLGEAMDEELRSLRKLNPFQILGLGYETDDASVRAAFGELTKRYHPDRFARYESTTLRTQAAEIFILIRDAYQKLGDASGRARTLAALRRTSGAPRPAADRPAATAGQPASPGPPRDPKPPPPASDARAPAPGPARPNPAAARPASGAVPAPHAPPPDPRPAAAPAGAASASPEPPRPASPLSPSGLFTSRLPDARGSVPLELGRGRPGNPHAHAEGLIDAGHHDEALAYYRSAARRNPGDRSTLAGIELVEGLKALAQRDRLEAAQRFEAVLEHDPGNERAARELAEMRRSATSERKGLLSRLLGKKE